MFESLTERLEMAFKHLKGESKLTEVNIASTLKDIRRALVAADVHYKIAREFTEKVKEEALGQQNRLRNVKPGQLLVKIVHEKLTELMGSDAVDIHLTGNPAIVLIAGLQGSGKTTFSAKLAKYVRDHKKKRPLLVACDVYRPAAIEQLRVLGEQIKVEVFSDEESKDPVDIARRAVEYARQKGYNVVIVDTAGRLSIDDEMMREIKSLKEALQPSETLFVVDAMTGQDAVNTAKAFNEVIDYDGVVLTKLDGDTRGGAALSIKYVVGKPLKFVSHGEKLNALDVFHPERMAQRILGMGDIVTLVEKAQAEIDEREARRLEKKIRKNQFDFNDFLAQIHQIRRMGDLKSLLSLLPGMNKVLKHIEIDDSAFKKIEAIILSMTPEERANPQILNHSRKRRIARGSGNDIHEVNQFIKQFEQMRKMMHQLSKGKGMFPLMQQLGLGKRR